MTLLDLIKRSMRLLNVLNVGDPPTADEAADGMTAMNSMIDAWGTRRLLIYSTARNIYPLTAGKQVYQLGPNTTAPDWQGPRPVAVDYAGLLLANADPTQAQEMPLHILTTEAEYARIRMKALTSTYPEALYCDRWYNNADPLTSSVANVGSANIYLWPAPTQANSVALYTPAAISQFTALTQLIALPPGYARALPYNLAVEFAPEFEVTPSDTVLRIASESLADLARMNWRARKLRADSSLDKSARGGVFDIYLGEDR